MGTLRVERTVGDMAHPSQAGRARQLGASGARAGATRRLPVLERQEKDSGGCKTCGGRHCVGRCRF